ncbi:transporter substrate-binding domain-containing protein [Pseudomonas alkylphenolica]|jgi:polar amino acid transport system substrate-binding protein|uniref:Transporter substrate-binding domain-containing protein n=1 Tax=Pseudomonas alkylphenolica TaxID=237609 RepID=A0A6I6GVK1_9PSED|nr:transporter substrate-binding domain-containing protein [Pseudomonas alkylphenolica]QGW78580.1 transporter substrate-binding domain-containing protein [Pseudomonas alkylphenolica]
MRWVLSLLMLYIGQLPATELPPLRFAVADSWTMPLVRLENNQPVEGIMFDLMNTLASRVQRRPEFHVMPRLRLQAGMERGSVDVRCFVMPSWSSGQSGNFSWSSPLFQQRDWLVAHPRETAPANLEQLPSQVIGAVLGFHYPALQAHFDNGHFKRDDARNQLQVLQKLQAGRYRYAVSSQLSLDWFNRSLPEAQRFKPVALLEEQALSCYVRNDPGVPTQGILRSLEAMKKSGEIERMVKHHTAALDSQTQVDGIAHASEDDK